jgi:hypothetical protein
MKRKISLFICLLVYALFTGCESGKEPGAHVPNLTPANGEVNGTRLATLSLTKTFTINFWELEPGEIAVNSDFSLDAPDNPKIQWGNLLAGKQSIVDFYTELAGSKSNPSELNALKEAEIRYQKREVEMQKMITPGKLQIMESGDALGTATEARIAANCSSDRFGDNWGEQWWKDTYCYGSINTIMAETDAGDCQWNIIRRSMPVQEGNVFLECKKVYTAACAADFNVGARFVVSSRIPFVGHPGVFLIRTDVNKTFSPRGGFHWLNLSTGVRRSEGKGLPDCPKVHFTCWMDF